MNKYFKYLVCAIIAVLTLSVYACDKGEKVQITQSNLHGTWKLTQKNSFNVFGDNIEYYQFKADGRVIVFDLDNDYGRMSASIEEKSYQLKRNKLRLHESDGDVEVFTILRYTGDSLMLRDDDRDRLNFVRVSDEEVQGYLRGH